MTRIINYHDTVTVRVEKETINIFKNWCEEIESTMSETLREFMIRAPYGELMIRPTYKQLEELNKRKKDVNSNKKTVETLELLYRLKTKEK